MGTRHLIDVILNKEVKVHQYGQWDGYPDVQGRDIAFFLHQKMDKDKFKKALSECRFLKKHELKAFDNKPLPPHLSRDAGAEILTLIQNHDARLLLKCDDKDLKEWCEYLYTINMDDETVTIDNTEETKTYPFAEWTNELMTKLEGF